MSSSPRAMSTPQIESQQRDEAGVAAGSPRSPATSVPQIEGQHPHVAGVPQCQPCRIQIVNVEQTDFGMPVRYVLQVSALGKTYQIRHTFKDFAKLRAGMVLHGLELPCMPPRSFFRAQFSMKFDARRTEQLKLLISAVAEVDPMVITPALRVFLHQEVVLTDKVASKKALRAVLKLTSLSSFSPIDELDEDCDDLGGCSLKMTIDAFLKLAEDRSFF